MNPLKSDCSRRPHLSQQVCPFDASESSEPLLRLLRSHLECTWRCNIRPKRGLGFRRTRQNCLNMSRTTAPLDIEPDQLPTRRLDIIVRQTSDGQECPSCAEITQT